MDFWNEYFMSFLTPFNDPNLRQDCYLNEVKQMLMDNVGRDLELRMHRQTED